MKGSRTNNGLTGKGNPKPLSQLLAQRPGVGAVPKVSATWVETKFSKSIEVLSVEFLASCGS